VSCFLYICATFVGRNECVPKALGSSPMEVTQPFTILKY
ncbi:unnamed protein product, partial [marine sediment metagenome]